MPEGSQQEAFVQVARGNTVHGCYHSRDTYRGERKEKQPYQSIAEQVSISDVGFHRCIGPATPLRPGPVVHCGVRVAKQLQGQNE